MIVEDAVFLDETMYACYTKGKEMGEDGKMVEKVYSTFQRNEVAQMWQRKDGSVFVTVRPKTGEESNKMRKEETESLQKALDSGEAARDRIGRIIWKKH